LEAQNLVPNGSFEDTLHCPDNGGQLDVAFPWHTPTTGSPDYFNQCGIAGYVGVPSNFLGLQSAKTGEGYAGFLAYGTSGVSYREYLQVQLTDSLEQGKEYCVQFFVNLSDVNPTYTRVAITEIGLFFSNTAVTSTNIQPLPYVPQIISPSGIYLSNTIQWMEVSGIYTAVGGEKHFTIGNFKDDINTDTIVLLNSSSPQAYYYIDDVSVIACDTGTSINEYENTYNFNLYPNPNNGEMILTYHLKESGTMAIYDLTGKRITQYILSSKNNKLNINEHSLRAGVYFYTISVKGKRVQHDKLVIIK